MKLEEQDFFLKESSLALAAQVKNENEDLNA